MLWIWQDCVTNNRFPQILTNIQFVSVRPSNIWNVYACQQFTYLSYTLIDVQQNRRLHLEFPLCKSVFSLPHSFASSQASLVGLLIAWYFVNYVATLVKWWRPKEVIDVRSMCPSEDMRRKFWLYLLNYFLFGLAKILFGLTSILNRVDEIDTGSRHAIAIAVLIDINQLQHKFSTHEPCRDRKNREAYNGIHIQANSVYEWQKFIYRITQGTVIICITYIYIAHIISVNDPPLWS